jgi:peptidoglycan/LPS O-acetylase OafA/YrhL
MEGGGRRRADIQGLRAVAVLLVVLYHAGLGVPGGFTGVDVFFAISGFVITSSLLPELAHGGGIAFRRFYARRVRRLLPALAVLLVVVAALGTVASPVDSQRTGALTGIWASMFSANVFLYRVGTGYFDPGASLDPLLHTWTLAVEEQFYLVFPLLLVVGWRARRRRGAIAAVGALSLVSFAAAVVLSGSPNDPSVAGRFAFYGSPTRAWEFGAGATLALAAGAVRGRRVRELVGAVGIAMILVAAFTFDGGSSVPGLATLLPVGGACALIAARGSFASRLLETRPLVWIGDVSYSWYLWHWPLIVFARAFWPHAAGWAALASIVPAWLSYRFVEAPFRRDPRFRGRATLALAAVCVAAPVIASLGLVVVEQRLQQSPMVERWDAANAHHDYVVLGCDRSTPLGARVGARWSACTSRVPRPKGVVYLIGDSNAGSLTEGFVPAANADGYDAVMGAYEGCPFIDLRVSATDVPNSTCFSFDRGTLNWLLAVNPKPSLVVIANRTDGYVDVSSKSVGPPSVGPLTRSQAAKGRLWREALTEMLRRFDAAGIPTVVVHPVPWIATLNDGCAVLLVLDDGCDATVTRSRAAHERQDAVAIENASVRAAGGLATTTDFFDEFCGPVICSSRKDGQDAYQDRDHLSPAGALLLEAPFRKLIAAHAVPAPGRLGSRV